MSKSLILIVALAIVVGLSAYANAEVQNIKVGGDLTTIALSRYGFNLTKPEDSAGGLVAITRVRFDADLTDDVMLTVRLLNERVWGSAEESNLNSDIDLDLAYVTLKEFLYSPLTLIVGRQNFRLGSGLLIGDPDTNLLDNSGAGLPAILGDLSSRKAFDGIVGILDYAPLILTLGYLNINESPAGEGTAMGLRSSGDNIDAYVVNAAYDFGDKGGTVGELYYVLTDNGDDYSGAADDVNNIGLRVVSSPFENLNASAEFVYQNTRRPAAEGTGHRSDYALLLATNYALPDVDWSPVIGFDYARLTDNWNVMFEDVTPADIINAIFPNTNAQVIGITAVAKPAEDLTAKLRFANIRLVDEVPGNMFAGNWTGGGYTLNPDKKNAGNEVDLHLMYDYTEDVQLGLSLGFFDAGKAFVNREDARQLIGTMKVTF